MTVQIGGEPFALMDIGMRMLTPRELARAQGFPDSYCLERGAEGEGITKTAQVRGVGNSVCLPLATVLVSANYHPQLRLQGYQDAPLLQAILSI